MAAVFAPLDEIEKILKTVQGYVVIANINSEHQAVIGGRQQGRRASHGSFPEGRLRRRPLTVSHAFHTSIVAPASEPLRRVLERLHLQSPRLPIVANVSGEFYPTGRGRRAANVGHSGEAGCFSGAIREGPAHAA